MAIRASGSASGHFRPVSSHILASLFFKVLFGLSTAPADWVVGTVEMLVNLERFTNIYRSPR